MAEQKDLLLSAEQIKYFKQKIGQKLKDLILAKNPRCRLFGGAVRDEILGVAPKDYDICATTVEDYANLLTFVRTKIGTIFSETICGPDQDEYEHALEFVRFKVNLFPVPLTSELTISFDIVMMRDPEIVDFDVNSLWVNASGRS